MAKIPGNNNTVNKNYGAQSEYTLTTNTKEKYVINCHNVQFYAKCSGSKPHPAVSHVPEIHGKRIKSYCKKEE